MEPGSPAWQADSFTSWATREAQAKSNCSQLCIYKTSITFPTDVTVSYSTLYLQPLHGIWRKICVPLSVGCTVWLCDIIQWLSRVQLFATPWTSAHHAYLFITNSQSLLNLMSIKLVMPSNHSILCHPFLLLPSIFPRIRVFYIELQHHSIQFSSVHSLSHVQLFATPWIAARQAPCPSSTPRVYSNSCPSSWWCHRVGNTITVC